jgi:hypothetical protein
MNYLKHYALVHTFAWVCKIIFYDRKKYERCKQTCFVDTTTFVKLMTHRDHGESERGVVGVTKACKMKVHLRMKRTNKSQCAEVSFRH